MSVALENVGAAGQPSVLFEGLSLRVEDRSRVGVLSTGKPEMALLLRLICGTKEPDEGVIRRDGRVSWPIPLSSFVAASQTVARNVRFIARLYGIDDEDFPRRIAETVELTEFLNTPISKCPRMAKARLAFALGVGLDFDLYLFNGSLAPVDKPFKEKAAKVSAERTAGRGLLVATSMPAEVEQNCESVYVLEQGRAPYFAEVSQGVEHFKQLLAMEKKKDRAGGGKQEGEDDEDEGLGEVDILGAAVADVVD